MELTPNYFTDGSTTLGFIFDSTELSLRMVALKKVFSMSIHPIKGSFFVWE